MMPLTDNPFNDACEQAVTKCLGYVVLADTTDKEPVSMKFSPVTINVTHGAADLPDLPNDMRVIVTVMTGIDNKRGISLAAVLTPAECRALIAALERQLLQAKVST